MDLQTHLFSKFMLIRQSLLPQKNKWVHFYMHFFDTKANESRTMHPIHESNNAKEIFGKNNTHNMVRKYGRILLAVLPEY